MYRFIKAVFSSTSTLEFRSFGAMELKCAVVFTLVSLLLVTANPHGYDVKGGAAARGK